MGRDKEAWDETVHHEEEGHYENGKLLEEEKSHYEEVVVTPGWTENKYVVDKPAWTENILKYKCVCNGCHAEFASDEEWIAHSKENAMNGDYNHMGYSNVPYYETVEHPEEGHWVCNGEPQEQEPEQKPENPDQKPEQPENPDVETPETPDAENPETPEQKPEANKENVQTQETETKKEGISPKTGDTASALPVAGAGLASLGVALATILKKRK